MRSRQSTAKVGTTVGSRSGDRDDWMNLSNPSRVQMKLLDLARDGIAADTQPLRRLHFPAAREIERFTDHGRLEAPREFVHDIGGIFAQQPCDFGSKAVLPHARGHAG